MSLFDKKMEEVRSIVDSLSLAIAGEIIPELREIVRKECKKCDVLFTSDLDSGDNSAVAAILLAALENAFAIVSTIGMLGILKHIFNDCWNGNPYAAILQQDYWQKNYKALFAEHLEKAIAQITYNTSH